MMPLHLHVNQKPDMMIMMCVWGDTNGVSVCQSTRNQGRSVTFEDESGIVDHPCTGTSIIFFLNFLMNCTKDL